MAIIDHERFHIPIGSCDFQSQYAEIYLSRLRIARPCLERQANRRWPELPIRALADVMPDEECIIIGTIFRASARKPSIIKQFAHLEQIGGRLELERQQHHHLTRLADSGDELFLEDEVQRITLSGQHSVDRITTGVVACLRGYEPTRQEGTFTVLEMAFLEPHPEKEIAVVAEPTSPPLLIGGGQWVCFVSGLGFGGTVEAADTEVNHDHTLALQLLGDWLRRIPLCRLFILGDSIRPSDPGGLETLGIIQQARFLTRKADADSVISMAHLDAWLSELPIGGDGGLTVEVLPGVADCVSQLLPQQPFHPLLFPRTITRFGHGEGALVSSTNPCFSEVHSRRILATAGQSVSDVYKYTVSGDTLDCMESLLHWGHIAPTSPDTLFAYPRMDNDCLLFRVDPETATSPDYPDVFVAGNQSTAQFRRASLGPLDSADKNREGALLIAVPRFDVSLTIILLELGSLSCVPLKFDLSQIE